jgi:small subunit ribosomal protein S8
MCSSAKAISVATAKKRWVPRQHKGIRIELKYFEGQPAIKHVARVSKPGRRVYSGSKELPVRNGLGITIVSTPRGVLSDAEAREQNVGGEVLAEVF